MVLTNHILAAIFVLGAVVFGLIRVFQTYLRYRGPACGYLPGDAATRRRACGRAQVGSGGHERKAADRAGSVLALARKTQLLPGMPEPDPCRSGKLPRLEHGRDVVSRKKLRKLPEAVPGNSRA